MPGAAGRAAVLTNPIPEFAAWTAKKRIEEAKSSGAEAWSPPVPGAKRPLMKLYGANGSNHKVYDIVELVEKAV